jgi:hypothetical protein
VTGTGRRFRIPARPHASGLKTCRLIADHPVIRALVNAPREGFPLFGIVELVEGIECGSEQDRRQQSLFMGIPWPPERVVRIGIL